jgi:hypothetical protein
MQDRILTAFFPRRAETTAALARLFGEGIGTDDIRLLPGEVAHPDDLGVRAGSKASDGAALGAVLGGAAAAIAGAAVGGGALVWPGVGAFLAGPVVAALAGAGAGGAVGAVLGAVFGARIPRYEAGYLDDAVRGGGSLLAVRCVARDAARLTAVLEASGGHLIRRARLRTPG